MQAGQRAGDGQTEARSLIGLGELALDLFERLAEPAQRIRGNADPGVGDHEHDKLGYSRACVNFLRESYKTSNKKKL